MGAGKISLGVTLVAQEREMRQVLRGRVMRIKEVGQIQARFRRWNQEGQLGGEKNSLIALPGKGGHRGLPPSKTMFSPGRI